MPRPTPHYVDVDWPGASELARKWKAWRRSSGALLWKLPPLLAFMAPAIDQTARTFRVKKCVQSNFSGWVEWFAEAGLELPTHLIPGMRSLQSRNLAIEDDCLNSWTLSTFGCISICTWAWVGRPTPEKQELGRACLEVWLRKVVPGIGFAALEVETVFRQHADKCTDEDHDGLCMHTHTALQRAEAQGSDLDKLMHALRDSLDGAS